jgi:hypothetical protein
MSNKFDNVPVEKDTRILFRKEEKIGNYDALHEKWNWEGIKAESIIFANDDISDLTDEEIEQEVRTSEFIKEGSQITLKRSEVFTYVNFNFETT